MRHLFLQPVIAMFSAARLLAKSRRALALMLGSYVGLLTVVYLFVSTREATIPQLFLTLALLVAAPVPFFVLQTISVSYTTGAISGDLHKNSLKVMVATLPVIGIVALGVYGLSKAGSLLTLATASRYLLIGVIAPLLAIQLWIAASSSGRLLNNLRKVAVKAFAPQSVVVYVCGFLIFALMPYLLITQKIPTERAWLEFSFLMVRLTASALLMLVGWVTTVGAISLLSRGSYSSEE
jgi:hypothetical protein